MDKKTKLIIGVGGIVLISAYLIFKKDDETTSGRTPSLDNPIDGNYMGDKPRSQGNASTSVTVETTSGFSNCLPALESEGGGKGKYISIDDPYTPGAVETARRQLITDNLSVGDTVDLDGRSCKIKKFYVDSQGLNAGINCENHNNITFNSNSKLCW